jgi:two-component system, chemotaxis family, chemotaxis protein CheY
MSAVAFGNLKALIVEDNPYMRELLRTLLHGLGVKHICESADGAAGYEALREHMPDFVLTDLSMKPVDGIAFARRVRMTADSPNPYIPIVMVTGHTERQSIAAARDAGVTEIIAKPITLQNLISRLTEILDKPRPFVRTDDYFGPDRRRRKSQNYTGPWRRLGDPKGDVVLV